MAGIISSAMTPAAQAAQLYQDNLGRAGDQVGVDYWAGQLASGKSLGDVTNSFKDSAKAVYSDVMNNPNSINANNPLIQGDMTNIGQTNAAAEAANTANGLDAYGTPTGPISASQQQTDAVQGLNTNIYNNLYGNGNQSAPPINQAGTNAASPTSGTSTGVSPSTGATTYTAAQLGNPNQWHVTPDQTVEGRVNNIIGQDSPIIQAARARADQAMNARGLLNSSMGVQAGEAAAYDAALPIASADAQTAAKAAGYNADQGNQFAVQNANSANQANLAGLSAATQRYTADTSAGTQRYTANLDAQTRTALANLDSSTKLQLTQLDDQNKQLLQTNSSAANVFSTYMNSIANIAQSTNMDQAAKDTATQNAIKNLNQELQVLKEISGADVSKYFVPEAYTPVTPTATPAASTTPDFNALYQRDGG